MNYSVVRALPLPPQGKFRDFLDLIIHAVCCQGLRSRRLIY